jgi:hypothetical protein
MATWIMASLASGWYSHRGRRHDTSQANVRSTTPRRGCARNPSAAFAAAVTSRRHARRTNSSNRLEHPLSAITSRTRGSRPELSTFTWK